MSRVEIVDSVPACRDAIAQLEREDYVAVHCEGVHVSRTGPITLIQVATARDRVFLFDVMQEPRIFKDGGLKKLLENRAILKVLHGTRSEAEALYWQHDVVLTSVHDTQQAQMEMDRADGRLFPLPQHLRQIVQTYCPDKEPLLTEGNDSVQTKCNKSEGEYWAKRPLTDEMKRYAVNDVIVLVPEVYQEQKALIERKGLSESYAKRVEEELRRTREQPLDDKLQKEEKDLVTRTLKTFVETPGASRKNYQDIDDANVQDALMLVWMQDIVSLGLPPFIKQLKTQQIETKLDEFQQELELKGDDFEVNDVICRRIHGFAINLDHNPALKRRAKDMDDKITNIVLDDVKRKYTVDTPASHLDQHEKLIVTRHLRPRSAVDPSIHPVLLKLHWKLKLEEVEDAIARHRKDRAGFKPSDAFIRQLKYYYSASVVAVPQELKQKGSSFLQVLQARPPR